MRMAFKTKSLQTHSLSTHVWLLFTWDFERHHSQSLKLTTACYSRLHWALNPACAHCTEPVPNLHNPAIPHAKSFRIKAFKKTGRVAERGSVGGWHCFSSDRNWSCWTIQSSVVSYRLPAGLWRSCLNSSIPQIPGSLPFLTGACED